MLTTLKAAVAAVACTLSLSVPPPAPEQPDYNRMLFRHALYAFYPVEGGAFQLFPYAPFGSRKPLLDRVAELLNLPAPRDEVELRRLAAVYLRFCAAFPDLVRQVRLQPGVWLVPEVDAAMRELDDAITSAAGEEDPDPLIRPYLDAFNKALDDSFEQYREEETIDVTDLGMAQTPALAVDIAQEFFVLVPGVELHECGETLISAELLERVLDADRAIREDPELYIEYPVPAGNGKRPYGDRNYYYWDLEDAGVPGAKAGGEWDPDNGRRAFSPEQEEDLNRRQARQYRVMQALSLHGAFTDEPASRP